MRVQWLRQKHTYSSPHSCLCWTKDTQGHLLALPFSVASISMESKVAVRKPEDDVTGMGCLWRLRTLHVTLPAKRRSRSCHRAASHEILCHTGEKGEEMSQLAARCPSGWGPHGGLMFTLVTHPPSLPGWDEEQQG